MKSAELPTNLSGKRRYLSRMPTLWEKIVRGFRTLQCTDQSKKSTIKRFNGILDHKHFHFKYVYKYYYVRVLIISCIMKINFDDLEEMIVQV